MFQFLKRSWHLITFHFPFCVILPPPIPMSPQSRTSLVSHYPTGIKGQLKLHKAAETTQIINKKHKIFPLEPRMPGEHCRSIILKQVNWGIFSKQQHIKSKCKETQSKLVLKLFVASHWTTHTTSEKAEKSLLMYTQETQQCTELQASAPFSASSIILLFQAAIRMVEIIPTTTEIRTKS